MKKGLAFLKTIILTSLVLVFFGVYFVKETDINAFMKTFFHSHRKIELGEVNEYYRTYDFQFVKNTEDFEPESLQDIFDIYYTVLNSGKETFTFYCPHEFEACLTNVQTLANDQNLLSDINNFVHPYNGFSHIETEYDNLGRVTINVTHHYTQEDIDMINERVDILYNNLVNPGMSVQDNIETIHNYIINTTRYDSLRTDQGIEKYQSDIAYGPLFEGYAVCGGYTDLMALFLEKMGLKNYKISSDRHVWNAVEINGVWYHLDLTWDDPVSSDGKDYLEYTYFLVSPSKFYLVANAQHDFNKNVYLELQ